MMPAPHKKFLTGYNNRQYGATMNFADTSIPLSLQSTMVPLRKSVMTEAISDYNYTSLEHAQEVFRHRKRLRLKAE